MRKYTTLIAGTVVGLLVGAILTAAVIFANPFVKPTKETVPISKAGRNGYTVEKFIFETTTDTVAATHNGELPLKPFPQGIPLLSEETIHNGFAYICKVKNEQGEIVGFAIETETVMEESNPFLGKMRIYTEWVIVIPSRGTIFISEIEDSGEVGKQILPTVMRGGAWNTPIDFISTIGPGPDGRGIIVGGTRDFTGITGSFVEVTHMRKMSKEEMDVNVELQLEYKLP